MTIVILLLVVSLCANALLALLLWAARTDLNAECATRWLIAPAEERATISHLMRVWRDGAEREVIFRSRRRVKPPRRERTNEMTKLTDEQKNQLLADVGQYLANDCYDFAVDVGGVEIRAGLFADIDETDVAEELE